MDFKKAKSAKFGLFKNCLPEINCFCNLGEGLEGGGEEWPGLLKVYNNRKQYSNLSMEYPRAEVPMSSQVLMQSCPFCSPKLKKVKNFDRASRF